MFCDSTVVAVGLSCCSEDCSQFLIRLALLDFLRKGEPILASRFKALVFSARTLDHEVGSRLGHGILS